MFKILSNLSESMFPSVFILSTFVPSILVITVVVRVLLDRAFVFLVSFRHLLHLLDSSAMLRFESH